MRVRSIEKAKRSRILIFIINKISIRYYHVEFIKKYMIKNVIWRLFISIILLILVLCEEFLLILSFFSFKIMAFFVLLSKSIGN